MTDPNAGHDIFISYARRDGLAYAERLERDLKATGVTTWRDKRNLDPDEDFTAELEVAIRQSKRVVCCITPDVERRDSFVRREIGYALAVNKPVVPLIFEGAIPPSKSSTSPGRTSPSRPGTMPSPAWRRG